MSGPNLNNVAAGISAKKFETVLIYTVSSYQINSGTAIAAGDSVTDSATFTGVLKTDTNIGIAQRLGTGAIPTGLQLTGISVTATNTVSLTWTNITSASITPPAANTNLYLGVFSPFMF